MPPRKPWHLSNGEPTEGEKASKRERVCSIVKYKQNKFIFNFQGS